jgi:hypothetical protein
MGGDAEGLDLVVSGDEKREASSARVLFLVV